MTLLKYLPLPGKAIRQRKPKFCWENPQDSIGKLIGSLKNGKYSVWEAKGPARAAYNVLAPQIKGFLENCSHPVTEDVFWSIYMIGRSEDTAAPTVIFCCPETSARKEIRTTIEESGIMERFPGIGLGDMSKLPDQQMPVRIALEDLEFETASETESLVYAAPSTTSLGRRLLVRNAKEDTLRPMTAGPVIYCNNKSYILSVAHAFVQGDHSTPKPERLPIWTDDCDFDGMSDSDAEDEDDEDYNQSITSRGSITPEDLQSRYDSSSGKGSDEQSRDGYSTDEESNNSSHTDKTAHAPSQRYSPDLESVSHSLATYAQRQQLGQRSTKTIQNLQHIGKLALSSESGSHPSLDYALIERSMASEEAENQVEYSSGHGSVRVRISKLAKIESENEDILVVTASGGVLSGRMIATASYMRLANADTFQEVYPVDVDGIIVDGDCGSAVFHKTTGDLYGHLVAGHPGTGTAYFVPASQVFEDIAMQLGGFLSLLAPESVETSQPGDLFKEFNFDDSFGEVTSLMDKTKLNDLPWPEGFGSSEPFHRQPIKFDPIELDPVEFELDPNELDPFELYPIEVDMSTPSMSPWKSTKQVCNVKNEHLLDRIAAEQQDRFARLLMMKRRRFILPNTAKSENATSPPDGPEVTGLMRESTPTIDKALSFRTPATKRLRPNILQPDPHGSSNKALPIIARSESAELNPMGTRAVRANGTCPMCHHFHDTDMMPRRFLQNQHISVDCDKCGHKWLSMREPEFEGSLRKRPRSYHGPLSSDERIPVRAGLPFRVSAVPFYCRPCTTSFRNADGLVQHHTRGKRSFKCSEYSCKFNSYDWPIQKELDRHINDMHVSIQTMYKCDEPGCTYSSKREVNCRQHKEKAHGWSFVRCESRGDRSNPQRPRPVIVTEQPKSYEQAGSFPRTRPGVSFTGDKGFPFILSDLTKAIQLCHSIYSMRDHGSNEAYKRFQKDVENLRQSMLELTDVLQNLHTFHAENDLREIAAERAKIIAWLSEKLKRSPPLHQYPLFPSDKHLLERVRQEVASLGQCLTFYLNAVTIKELLSRQADNTSLGQRSPDRDIDTPDSLARQLEQFVQKKCPSDIRAHQQQSQIAHHGYTSLSPPENVMDTLSVPLASLVTTEKCSEENLPTSRPPPLGHLSVSDNASQNDITIFALQCKPPLHSNICNSESDSKSDSSIK